MFRFGDALFFEGNPAKVSDRSRIKFFLMSYHLFLTIQSGLAGSPVIQKLMNDSIAP